MRGTKAKDRPDGIALGTPLTPDEGIPGAMPGPAEGGAADDPHPATTPQVEGAGPDPWEHEPPEIEKVVRLIGDEIRRRLPPPERAQPFAPSFPAPSDRVITGKQPIPAGDPVRVAAKDPSRRRIVLQVPTDGDPAVIASTRELAQAGHGWTLTAGEVPLVLYTTAELWGDGTTDTSVQFVSEHGAPLDVHAQADGG